MVNEWLKKQLISMKWELIVWRGLLAEKGLHNSAMNCLF